MDASAAPGTRRGRRLRVDDLLRALILGGIWGALGAGESLGRGGLVRIDPG